MGIPRALVTCFEDNTGSRRVIENNGGVLENIVDGRCLYWIRLDEDTGMRELHPDDYPEMIGMWKNTPGIGISRADSESGIRGFLLRNPGLSWCYKDGGRYRHFPLRPGRQKGLHLPYGSAARIQGERHRLHVGQKEP